MSKLTAVGCAIVGAEMLIGIRQVWDREYSIAFAFFLFGLFSIGVLFYAQRKRRQL